MAYIAWIFRVLVFLLLLGFALENLQTVTVRYYFVFQWETYLVVVIVVALLVGVALGLLAVTRPLYRQRRQIQQLKRELKLYGQIAAKPAGADPSATGENPPG